VSILSSTISAVLIFDIIFYVKSIAMLLLLMLLHVALTQIPLTSYFAAAWNGAWMGSLPVDLLHVNVVFGTFLEGVVFLRICWTVSVVFEGAWAK